MVCVVSLVYHIEVQGGCSSYHQEAAHGPQHANRRAGKESWWGNAPATSFEVEK